MFYNYVIMFRVRDDGEGLCIDCVHMSQLEGHTAELIGTNINGNPYGNFLISTIFFVIIGLMLNLFSKFYFLQIKTFDFLL
jgi:hypothetical protein